MKWEHWNEKCKIEVRNVVLWRTIADGKKWCQTNSRQHDKIWKRTQNENTEVRSVKLKWEVWMYHTLWRTIAYSTEKNTIVFVKNNKWVDFFSPLILKFFSDTKVTIGRTITGGNNIMHRYHARLTGLWATWEDTTSFLHQMRYRRGTLSSSRHSVVGGDRRRRRWWES